MGTGGNDECKFPERRPYYGVRCANLHGDANRDANRHGDSDGNRHGHGDCHRYSDSDSDSNSNRHDDSDGNGYAHRNPHPRPERWSLRDHWRCELRSGGTARTISRLSMVSGFTDWNALVLRLGAKIYSNVSTKDDCGEPAELRQRERRGAVHGDGRRRDDLCGGHGGRWEHEHVLLSGVP